MHSCSTEARMARQLLLPWQEFHDYKKQLWGCFSVVLKIPPVLHTVGLICGLLTHRIHTHVIISQICLRVSQASPPQPEKHKQ